MKSKYSMLTQVLAKGNKFSEPFELDHKIDAFIAEYKLGGDIEMLPEVDESGEKQAKLKPSVAKELKRTYDLFMSEKYAEERLEKAKESIKKQVKDLIKKVAKKYASKIEVEVREDDGQDYYALKIELELDGQEETIEPSNFYYSYEPGLAIHEAAQYGSSKINWAAWLGMDASPFGDTSFVDSYDKDSMSTAFDQFAATTDESMFNEDVIQVIQKLVADYEASEE